MKNNVPIKVGFLVSYDWALLKNSLPLVYQQADSICLALDKQRLSWTGQPFKIDEKAFMAFIKEIDEQNKIHLYEDSFYIPSLTPMQCEVRERNLLAEYMGKGGWHIQLDTDEYFINFSAFIQYLKKMPISQKEINICVALINLFKKTTSGYFLVKTKDLDFIPVATNQPKYEYGRRNGYFNHIAPFFMLHDTWARSEEEVMRKITSWGHANDFDVEKYFQFWQKVDEHNYLQIRNFHPIEPEKWHSLSFVEVHSIQDIIEKLQQEAFPWSRLQLSLKNNRNIARIRHLWSKISG